jgi:hypothetical protein
MGRARSSRQKINGVTIKSCFCLLSKVVCFLSYGVHKNMSVESAIEKLQIVRKEKETHNSEHRRRHEEEVEKLKKIEAEKELRRVERARMLNIQLMAVRSLSHSPSSSECEEGNVYNDNMQFAHTIIQDIHRSRTSTIEFLHKCRRGWSSNE